MQGIKSVPARQFAARRNPKRKIVQARAGYVHNHPPEAPDQRQYARSVPSRRSHGAHARKRCAASHRGKGSPPYPLGQRMSGAPGIPRASDPPDRGQNHDRAQGLRAFRSHHRRAGEPAAQPSSSASSFFRTLPRVSEGRGSPHPRKTSPCGCVGVIKPRLHAKARASACARARSSAISVSVHHQYSRLHQA